MMANMPEILSGPLDEFMMDLCFPVLRSARCSHCDDSNMSGPEPVNILVFKSKTKQNQMVGFWPYEYTQEQRLETVSLQLLISLCSPEFNRL